MGDIDMIARIINPDAFACHQALYDYSLRLGDTEDEARSYADGTHGPDCDLARAKAEQVLEAITPPAHIINASKDLRRIYDALPKIPRCRECADGDGVRCLNSDVPCDPTDWAIELIAPSKNKGN